MYDIFFLKNFFVVDSGCGYGDVITCLCVVSGGSHNFTVIPAGVLGGVN